MNYEVDDGGVGIDDEEYEIWENKDLWWEKFVIVIILKCG